MDKWLVILHATLGGIGLLSGYINLFPKKGSPLHVKLGKVFVYSMTASSLLAILVTFLPGHSNPFLLCIGVFTLYLVLTGARSLKWYKGLKFFDFALFYSMGFCSLAMIILGVESLMEGSGVGYLFLVFGGIGGSGAIQDLRMARKGPVDYQKGLSTHISRILGGLIAATTAFIVVNQWIPGLWGWLSPSVIGTACIIYFQRKRARA